MKSFKEFIIENGRYSIPPNEVGIEREQHFTHKDGRFVIHPASIGIRDKSVKEMYHGDTDMDEPYTIKERNLNDRLIKHHGYSHTGSTADHSTALFNYTRYSSDLNQHLHNRHLGHAVSEYKGLKHDTHVKALDKAFDEAKPAPEDYHVYSGVHFSPQDLIDHQERSKGRKAAEVKGEGDDHIKVHFPAYTSTSLSPHRAQYFAKNDLEGCKHIIKFKIPKDSKHGTHLAGISNFESEMETLLNRGRNAKIHKTPEVKDTPQGKVKIWHAQLED